MRQHSNYLLKPFFLLLLAVVISFAATAVLAHLQPFEGVEVKVFNPIKDILPTPPKAPAPMPEPPIAVIAEEPVEEVIEEAVAEEPTTPNVEVPPITLEGRVVDYSADGKALSHIRELLKGSGGGSVYMAFLGDSFIEGDILVGPFRNTLQARYGGKGVGYTPLTSESARFRTTVKHKFEGKWKALLGTKPVKGNRFLLSERIDKAVGKASATFEMPTSPKNLAAVDRVTLLYLSDSLSTFNVAMNANEPVTYTSEYDSLAPQTLYAHTLAEKSGDVNRVKVSFPEGFAGSLYGLFLDGREGVVVDNFTLRGSSGLQLVQVSSPLIRQFSAFRPYDVIFLSYGLNVASTALDDTDSYGWYYAGMEKSLNHLKELYPNAVFVIMSVSDRATIDEGEVAPLPAVARILNLQNQLARKYGCLFWNTYNAMQEKGGIKGYVERGWAAKDYTHLSYAGGRELAKALVADLLGE